MDSKNVDSYRSLKWILNDSEEGLFFLIASERMQQEIEALYHIPKVAIYNYKQHPGSYSINTLEEWISRQSDVDVYFIMNFQFAVQDKEDIIKLNFSRDVLADLKKNIIFCLTTWTDDKLARNAYDFYSYIKLRIFFEDEFLENVGVDAAKADAREVIDKSAGVDREAEIDFGQPKELLLSQAIALINQAEQLCDEFRYSDALSLLSDVVTIREKLLGERHQDTVTAYAKLARIYVNNYEYGKALEYYDKALSIGEEMLEHEDSLHTEDLIAETYSDIAEVYRDQGEHVRALKYCKKAMLIREKVYGTEHPATAAIYNNTARVYVDRGEYVKALEYYNKAMSIREKVYGTEHPETAMTYNNIARVYVEQGEYAKALVYYNKAMSIREEIYGTEHPTTAVTYNDIAEAYREQGEYAKALEYCNKAMSINEKVYGKEHPEIIYIYNNIALEYEEQGEYVKASEYYNKAMSISEKVYGTEHPATATIYNNIAGVYREQGEYTKAMEYYSKAMSIKEKVYGKEHITTANTYNNIAIVYDDRGEYAKALEYYNKALTILQLKFGENHPYIEKTLNNINELNKSLSANPQ